MYELLFAVTTAVAGVKQNINIVRCLYFISFYFNNIHSDNHKQSRLLKIDCAIEIQ